MTEYKHTQGPFRVSSEGYICSELSGYVPLVTPFREDAHRDQHGATTREALANARLFAAAPDLLEALESIARMTLDGETLEDGAVYEQSIDDAFDTLSSVIKLSRQAIAKVKGA